MSRPRSSQSVALFPFLAVLVCTMGALIFLLLITTRMIRDRVTQSVAVAPPAPQLPLMSLSPPPESTAADPSPIPFVVPAEPDAPPQEPSLDVHAVALEQRQRDLAALAAQWQNRLNTLNDVRDERARLRSQRQQLQNAAAKRLATMQNELRELEVKLGNMTGELSASAMGNGTIQERIELETQIKELKRRLRAAQQAEASDESKFQVVPFDVITGTSRRPILIECSASGLKFIPEDVSITKQDLAGFNPHVNPILAGANALTNYWTAWNMHQPNPARQPEPYVLLMVRPSGTVAYYVAMNMLRDLKQPHGYELVEEDTEFQLPAVDVGAKAACETAVRRLIAERDQVLRAAGMGVGGTGRGGTGSSGAGGNPGRSGGAPYAGGGAGKGTFGGGPIAAGGPRDGTSGTGSKDSAGTGKGDPDKFELTDIMTKEEASGNSWERVENFEGPSRRGGSPPAIAKGGMPKGPIQGAKGTSRDGIGAGSANSTGKLAVAAGGTLVDDPDGAESGSTMPAKPGTVPGSKGASADSSGIESLEDEEGDDAPNGNSQQPGTSSRPDIGLGSSGKRSIPVEDHRGKKRKSSDREAPNEPEQLAHRHWGLSEPGAAIGLEREVRIDVEPGRYVIGRKHAVKLDEADAREDTFAKVVTVLDLQARDWGKPPQGFFWKPSLRFVIAEGGDANYERVHSLLERAGLTSTREYAVEYGAEATEKPKAIEPQPVHTPAPATAKPQRRLFRGILR